MTRIIWGEVGSKQYTTGVDRGVLYPSVGPGVPWNGLVSIQETSPDADIRITYMDGQKVQTQVSLGNFAAQLSAFTYPVEFDGHDGLTDDGWSSQARKQFDLSYRTLIADDIREGYQIHLVFNALASPTSRDNEALSNTPDIQPFQWDIETTPEMIPGARPAAHVVVDSTLVYPAALAAIEDMLYGSLTSAPYFPTMTELLELFESFAIFKVTDQGNGIATVSGPDVAVYASGPDSAIFTWPSVVQLDEETYQLTSL